jgi:MFS family permease
MKGHLGVARRGADAVPRALLVVSGAVALSLLGDQMLYAVLPIVHTSVGVPVTSIGLLLSANRFVRLLTNSLAGCVVERVGRHWPFVVALLVGGLTTIGYGLLHGVWALLVTRMLWGTAWSFIRIEGLSTVLDVASEATRGRYMGWFQAISRLGSAVALLTGGILTDVIGFRTTFILFGALSCGAALMVHAEMRRRRTGAARRIPRPQPVAPVDKPPPPAPSMSPQPIPAGADWQARWRRAVVCFGTFCTFLVIGGLVSATLGYVLRTRFGALPEVWGVSIGIASLTGFLLSTRGFLDLGFAPVAGLLADRWGRHQIIRCALPLALVATVGMMLSPALLAVVGLVVLMFAAGTTLNVAFNATAGDIAPPGKRSMFLSLFVTFQDLGAAIGPLLGYWIAPTFGFVWLYLSGSVVLLLASTLHLVVFFRKQRAT